MADRAVQDLAHDVTGQSFVLDAPEGRPSSVTSVTVFADTTGDDGTAETATTGSASVDTPNTTFDAASGSAQSDPKLCSVAATTGIIIGRDYLAVNALNESEWVEVVGITSGASVQARTPLQNAYANADTFQSTRMSISVLDAWIQNVNKITDGADPNPGYRIRWVYVVTPPGGTSTTVVRYTYADVVRVAGGHTVTPADMDRYSDWATLLPVRHREDGGRSLISEAYARVKEDLFASGIPDQQIREGEVMNGLVKRAALMLLHQGKYLSGGDETRFDVAKRDYDELVTKLVRVDTKVAIGVDTSGAATRAKASGLWSR